MKTLFEIIAASLLSLALCLIAIKIFDKEKKCTEVRAYIPVKGKWLEKNVCLEGEK